MYAAGSKWKDWMRVYRYGTLVFYPRGRLGRLADSLRHEFDPTTASAAHAHITVTQPFLKPPTDTDLRQIKDVVRDQRLFRVRVGPVVPSPNGKMIWLDIEPAVDILSLREKLHETGLFNVTLPFTLGFIPHLTISEKGRPSDEVERIAQVLNERFRPFEIDFNCVTWSAPNEEFIFEEVRDFALRRPSTEETVRP